MPSLFSLQQIMLFLYDFNLLEGVLKLLVNIGKLILELLDGFS
jgi:hypothetical protein